jgi:UDP-glucose 4-epimerase
VAARTALLTGGAGYIGSHTAVELLDDGWSVVIVDDLSNASPIVVDRIAEIVGIDRSSDRLVFERVSILDDQALDAVFAARRIDAVVHFAGLKAVGESVEQPLRYYRTNVAGTIVLLDVMRRHDVRSLVFSSSCTVYGDPAALPVREETPRTAASPYGRTKLVIEHILEDVAVAEPGWRISCLRYFNPVGAHPSGRLGEDPFGPPNNLMPMLMQVAVGRQPCVRVFGNDYPTPDGTGVRDYLHVVDLALGHVAALIALPAIDGFQAVNLGTGTGHSVLEVIDAASRAVGQAIPFEVVDRRPGDVAAIWADPTRAHELLHWTASRTLDDMCADHWRWQSANPNGYRDDVV